MASPALRIEDWILPSTFDDVFYQWLGIADATDLFKKLEFLTQSDVLQNRQDLRDAYCHILRPAILQKKNAPASKPRIFRVVELSDDATPNTGMDIHVQDDNGTVRRLVSVLVLVSPGVKIIVADAINALIQLISFFINVSDEAQARDRLILAYYISSLVFDPDDMPSVWSAALFLSGQSRSQPAAGVANALSACTTPGQWGSWAKEKKALVSARRAEFESLLGPEAFAGLRAAEEQGRALHDAGAMPSSRAEIANCAETIVFFWICRTLKGESPQAKLAGLTIRIIGLQNKVLPDIVQGLQRDRLTMNPQGLRSALATRLSPPPLNVQPRSKGIRWAIAPCWRCQTLGASVYELAAKFKVTLVVEHLKGTGVIWQKWDISTVSALVQKWTNHAQKQPPSRGGK
ncbi:hypothetical protein CALCODRAFT_483927 [Calocera cornea HHB12733]|uniref:Uncharacterized protein n=1 Tax=Calocera cornea HHB12733 TaxID=1353952 RepID=A0A165FA08_9BASI|nr:hypothetical protein CALCODRAFT_483927 [Calocera cornea HHB12733]